MRRFVCKSAKDRGTEQVSPDKFSQAEMKRYLDKLSWKKILRFIRAALELNIRTFRATLARVGISHLEISHANLATSCQALTTRVFEL